MSGSQRRKITLPRARLPLGTWGQITRMQLKPNIWRARATFRSFDGVVRRYEAWGASGPKAETLRAGCPANFASRFRAEVPRGWASSRRIEATHVVIFDQHDRFRP